MPPFSPTGVFCCECDIRLPEYRQTARGILAGSGILAQPEAITVNVSQCKQRLASESARRVMARLYGDRPELCNEQVVRYSRLLDAFARRFPESATTDVAVFSAPGRTEVGGNHTDHNNGCVLAAAIQLDTIAVAAPTTDGIVTIFSEGYREPFVVDTADLEAHADERGGTNALIRGVAARLRERGFRVGGFQACVTSDVGVGSGLSSSAAFEVLVGAILSAFYNDGRIEPSEIAMAGRHAENHFFGKPSGLMDQMTSAVGGFVTIDFANPMEPAVRKVECDLAASGLALVVTDTGGSHADLTPEYASVQAEMQAVAQALGAEVLRDVSPEQLLDLAGELRTQLGDRAILRAVHFFDDNERVADQVAALEAGDVGGFLDLVRASGRSSWQLLQNCYVPGETEQGLALAQMLSAKILGERGAWRVHGGGFAGTILAVVPEDLLDAYVGRMECTFGQGAACVLRVREDGATRIEIE